MTLQWTPDRPTKPGRYEVCFGPPRGFDGYRVWVVEVWRERPSGKLLARRGILDIPIEPESGDIDTLTEALWRPYVEPPDPFAEPSPEITKDAVRDYLYSLGWTFGRDVGGNKGIVDPTKEWSVACYWTAQQQMEQIADMRSCLLADVERDVRGFMETKQVRDVESLRERVEALPVWPTSSGAQYLDRSEVLALLDEVPR